MAACWKRRNLGTFHPGSFKHTLSAQWAYSTVGRRKFAPAKPESASRAAPAIILDQARPYILWDVHVGHGIRTFYRNQLTRCIIRDIASAVFSGPGIEPSTVLRSQGDSMALPLIKRRSSEQLETASEVPYLRLQAITKFFPSDLGANLGTRQ
jgi:hypothetical protein